MEIPANSTLQSLPGLAAAVGASRWAGLGGSGFAAAGGDAVPAQGVAAGGG